MSFVLTGLDLEAKAAMAETALFERLGGRDRFQSAESRLVGRPAADPASAEEAVAELRVTVKDPDPAKVGRAFSNAAIELALANYPGCYTTTPPGDATPYGVYWPALVPPTWSSRSWSSPTAAASPSSRRPRTPRSGPAPGTPEPHRPVPGPPVGERSPALDLEDPAVHSPPTPPRPYPPAPTHRPTVRAPLGRVFGARSGDKGGNANVGVWARNEAAYRFLDGFLTVERFRELIPEARGLVVHRFALPNLLALNFVVVGLLGEGVSSSTRIDPQAKGLGEWLRARVVELPVELLEPQGG